MFSWSNIADFFYFQKWNQSKYNLNTELFLAANKQAHCVDTQHNSVTLCLFRMSSW